MAKPCYLITHGNVKRIDENAFDRLYLDHHPQLLAYARCFVSPEDAEEAVQSVMLWLWENRNTVAITGSLQGYLLRAVRNHCLNMIAQGEARQRLNEAIAETLQPSYEEICRYDLELLAKMANQAILNLPPDYRHAFINHRLKGKKCAAIAEEQGVSEKTIEYRMTQATKILRKALKEFL